jgi:hypothetical protein
MQALVQSFESLVAAMACAAFAHFGVALKGPCPQSAQTAHRIPVATAPAAPRPATVRVVVVEQRRI